LIHFYKRRSDIFHIDAPQGSIGEVIT